MSGEELEKVKGIVKRLYAGTGVTIGDIVDTAPWLDKLVNEVEELQIEIKEYQELTDNLRGENAELRDDLDELKRDNETLCEMAFIRPMPLPHTTPAFTSTDAYVSKEKVKNIVNKFVEKLNDLLGE